MGEVWPSDPRPGARCQLTAVIRHEGAAYRLILSPLSPSPVSAPPSHCIWTAVTSFFSLYHLFVVDLSVPFDEFPANCAGSSVCTGCA